MIALIVLVAMTMAGIAMVRSTDTGNLISGNSAFRTAALHTADYGVEAAFAQVVSTFSASPTAAVTSTAGLYFPVINDADSNGLPDVDWTTIIGTVTQGNTVKWVVERMCATAVTDPTDIANQCATFKKSAGTSPNSEMNNAATAPIIQSTAYRVTVRVEGPRNTAVLVQSTIAR